MLAAASNRAERPFTRHSQRTTERSLLPTTSRHPVPPHVGHVVSPPAVTPAIPISPKLESTCPNAVVQDRTQERPSPLKCHPRARSSRQSATESEDLRLV